MFGVLLMLGYLGFDGFTSTFQDKLFKGYNMTTYNQILYTTLWSSLLSLFGGWCRTLPLLCPCSNSLFSAWCRALLHLWSLLPLLSGGCWYCCCCCCCCCCEPCCSHSEGRAQGDAGGQKQAAGAQHLPTKLLLLSLLSGHSLPLA